MKLSRCQARTLRRLEEEYKADPSRWFTKHELAESSQTLMSLVIKGFAEQHPTYKMYRHRLTK